MKKRESIPETDTEGIRKTFSLPKVLKIVNLNSKVPALGKMISPVRIVSRLRILTSIAPRIPVYLIDETTMDRIYPPEKRRIFDEERLKRVIHDTREDYPVDDEKDIAVGVLDDRMESCRKETEITAYFVAVGIYVRHVPNIDDLNLPPTHGPAIFITPERVGNWGEKHNIKREIIFDAVLYHELAHALMDDKKTSTPKTWWRNVIEESFANAMSYSRFDSPEEKGSIIQCIQNQPVEYRGYSLFIEGMGSGNHFFSHPDPDIMFHELHYLMRRFGYFPYFNQIGGAPFFLWKKTKGSGWFKDKSDVTYVENFWKQTALDILREIV